MLSCFFHSWSYYGDVVDSTNSYYKYQFRVCMKCGAVDTRKISLSDGTVPAKEINDSLFEAQEEEEVNNK